jgi:hypothetical protein
MTNLENLDSSDDSSDELENERLNEVEAICNLFGPIFLALTEVIYAQDLFSVGTYTHYIIPNVYSRARFTDMTMAVFSLFSILSHNYSFQDAFKKYFSKHQSFEEKYTFVPDNDKILLTLIHLNNRMGIDFSNERPFRFLPNYFKNLMLERLVFINTNTNQWFVKGFIPEASLSKYYNLEDHIIHWSDS